MSEIELDSIKFGIDQLVSEKDAKYLNEKYLVEKCLGEGGFGKVFKVKNKLINKHCAMKVIERGTKLISDDNILKEIVILKNLDYPNILKIYDYYVSKEKIYIITEFCPEGNLDEEIFEKRKKPLSEVECAYIMRQMLKAMRYYHLMGVIHRDIKLDNIMITKHEDNGCLEVKLIDFGIATFYSGKVKTKGIGTMSYISPEVLLEKYDEKCDIWSLGASMYILLTSKFPFETEISEDDLKKKIINGDYDKTSKEYLSLSDNAKDLISRMLVVDPVKRISEKEALEHEWFNTSELKDKNIINKIDPFMARLLIRNICSYKKDNLLKCAALAYLVHNNTNLEPCKEAGKLFKKVDLNKDGVVKFEELKEGIENYWGLPKDEAEVKAKEILKNLDNDDNGFIEYEEFVRAAVNPKLFLVEKYARFAFQFFDKDKSGDISIEEIKNKFEIEGKGNGKIIEEQLKDILKKINVKENQPITAEIFWKIIKNIL